MNIYEKISIYTAMNYGADNTFCFEIMNHLGEADKGTPYKTAWEVNELTHEDLQTVFNEHYDRLNIKDKGFFNDVLTNSPEKDHSFDEFIIIAKKKIDDSLSEQDREIEIDKFHNQLVEDIKQLDRFDKSDFSYAWDSETLNAQEIYQNERWAYVELFNAEERLPFYIDYNIQNKNFLTAYTESDDKSDLDFMKKVISFHGTDIQSIQDAVAAITDYKGETPDFTAKLLQATLKTEEYKQAFEKEQGQGKTQENTR